MIPQRVSDKTGLKVSAIGYGAMVLEGYCAAANVRLSPSVLKQINKIAPAEAARGATFIHS
jgi:carbon starvation protein CstA